MSEEMVVRRTVNIRSKPAKEAALIGVLYGNLGTVVTVLGPAMDGYRPLALGWVWEANLEAMVGAGPATVPAGEEQAGAGRVAAEDGFRFQAWPTETRGINQGFGARPEYYAQFGMPGHEGLDIRAAKGSAVYAVAAGTVVAVGDERLPKSQGGHNYGVRVYLDHGGKYQTVYAHLERRLVNVGDVVEAGQKIGEADSTGNSGGDHLHLTLKRYGATKAGETAYPYDIIDPTPFLEGLM